MKISIITVCYNCVETLENTILSVINQSFQDIEYIVIDGNSTDGTTDILKSYSDKIDHIICEDDSGIYNAMNKGLDLCSGDYVFFLNCGDTLYNETVLENLINQSNGEDILYGELMLNFKDGRKAQRWGQPAKVNRFLFIYHTMLHQATFVKRKLFEMYGKFDEQYVILADFDFFLRVVFKPNMSLLYIPLIVSDYDMHGISSSNKTFKLRQRERVRILKKHMPFCLYIIARFRYYLILKRNKATHKKLLFYIDKVLFFLRGK